MSGCNFFSSQISLFVRAIARSGLRFEIGLASESRHARAHHVGEALALLATRFVGNCDAIVAVIGHAALECAVAVVSIFTARVVAVVVRVAALLQTGKSFRIDLEQRDTSSMSPRACDRRITVIPDDPHPLLVGL